MMRKSEFTFGCMKPQFWRNIFSIALCAVVFIALASCKSRKMVAGDSSETASTTYSTRYYASPDGANGGAPSNVSSTANGGALSNVSSTANGGAPSNVSPMAGSGGTPPKLSTAGAEPAARPADKGAPKRPLMSKADLDGDGVINELDSCGGTIWGHPVDSKGCSTIDKDGDGVGVQLDVDDRIPGQAACYGVPCRDEDSDGDGVPDRLDKDPEHAGSPQNHGLPTMMEKPELVRFSFETFSSDPNPEDLADLRQQVLAIKGEQSNAVFLLIGLTDKDREHKNLDYARQRLRVIMEQMIRWGVSKDNIELEPQVSSAQFRLPRAVYVFVKDN